MNYAILQVVLAEWDGYYFAQVIEEDPLRLMFAHEPITIEDDVQFVNKSLKWNRNDEQLSDNDYIVCDIPNEMIRVTKTGLQIVDKFECTEYLMQEISAYKL